MLSSPGICSPHEHNAGAEGCRKISPCLWLGYMLRISRIAPKHDSFTLTNRSPLLVQGRHSRKYVGPGYLAHVTFLTPVENHHMHLSLRKCQDDPQPRSLLLVFVGMKSDVTMYR